LSTLPQQDARSRAVVARMKDDEARHAEHALAAGARALPKPIPALMRLASNVMKTVAYRLSAALTGGGTREWRIGNRQSETLATEPPRLLAIPYSRFSIPGLTSGCGRGTVPRSRA